MQPRDLSRVLAATETSRLRDLCNCKNFLRALGAVRYRRLRGRFCIF
jgi:hypothetical protein